MTISETNLNKPGPSGTTTLHTPTHSANPSLSSSTRSYAPVLIHPTTSPNDPPSSIPEPPFLTLKYPYPLPIASILDLAYTIHHQYTSFPSGGTWWSTYHLTAGSIVRAVVLIGVCGASRRWRNRGGWVAAICGICVGGGIWEDCVERLGAGAGVGHGKKQGRQSWFLYTTILICISEYLLYLLLLRLSPPLHRSSNPFSLRRPLQPQQTDIPFHFDSEDLEYTPRSVRYRRFSRGHIRSRSGKGHSGLFTPLKSTERAENEAGPSRSRRSSYSIQGDDNLSDIISSGEDHPGFSDEEEGSDEDDASSFSESSIIDLPPPRSPHRIIPPSLSMNSGLNIGGQPIIGGMIRRTRSARYLGMSRSWGSVVERMEEGGLGQRMQAGVWRGADGAESGVAGDGGEGGYGTFGAGT